MFYRQTTLQFNSEHESYPATYQAEAIKITKNAILLDQSFGAMDRDNMSDQSQQVFMNSVSNEVQMAKDQINKEHITLKQISHSISKKALNISFAFSVAFTVAISVALISYYNLRPNENIFVSRLHRLTLICLTSSHLAH